VLYAATHFLVKFQAIAIGCLFSVVLFKYPVEIKMPASLKVLTNLLAFAIIILIRYDDFITIKN